MIRNNPPHRSGKVDPLPLHPNSDPTTGSHRVSRRPGRFRPSAATLALTSHNGTSCDK